MKLVVFGAGGQDGKILSQQASVAGDQVFGVGRMDPATPLASEGVADLLQREAPKEIYYLAAHHRSSEENPGSDTKEWTQSFETHLHGWMNVLDAVKKHVPQCRLLYATSAHIFGAPTEVPQSENTTYRPLCAYGSSKLAGMEVGKWYRKKHGIFVSHAILYPHESIYRGPTFLSKKLLLAADESSRHPERMFKIGDPQALADWGYAPEYTQAMRNILLLNDPDDFLICTGRASTVADFARDIFGEYGLDWQQHLSVDPSLLTKPTRNYIGNPQKLLKATGFKPVICLPELARQLVRDFRKPL